MKVLIADDEPLVQIGLKSMLSDSSLDLQICGTASNGEQAYQMIVESKPDVVISDIKMPLMSGLELAKKCHHEFGRIPAFIILTGYEDFQFAREALSFQAVDYLIKMELTNDELDRALKKAQQIVLEYRKLSVPDNSSLLDLSYYRDRFFIRLLNGLFEGPEQFERQSQEFQITFEASGYIAAYIRVIENDQKPLTREQKLLLNKSTLEMFQEMMSKYLHCQVISLDIQYFAAVFFISSDHVGDPVSYLREALGQTLNMLYKYYSVTLLCSIGTMVSAPLEIPVSYQDAKQFISSAGTEQLIFAEERLQYFREHNVFNLSLFREDIRRAFEESNTEALREILDNIRELLSQNRVSTAQALDAASSILYLSINLMEDGSSAVTEIFQDDADGYQSLYRLTTVPQILSWLLKLENGLLETLAEQAKKPNNYLVENVKKYIACNLNQRLTLQNTAMTFNISANYLSQLFKKNTEIGFNEYVALKKIEQAKKLLKQGNLKIYEIADELGFENAFYFSRVFKKIEGCSPRDFLNLNQK
ncbi:MAG: response regulator [Eubacteriales bacterium]|nr:response regulator [Eubacteriales bacterium]